MSLVTEKNKLEPLAMTLDLNYYNHKPPEFTFSYDTLIWILILLNQLLSLEISWIRLFFSDMLIICYAVSVYYL